MSIEDEINEIEKYIKTLEMNDSIYEEKNQLYKDGNEKGLIYDFLNPYKQYRGTIFSSKVIQKEDYDEFQKYIERCENESISKYKKWREETINSGVEYSKDELKYNKMF